MVRFTYGQRLLMFHSYPPQQRVTYYLLSSRKLIVHCRQVQNVRTVLHELELHSGLAVSRQNSRFSASNLSDSEIAVIQVSTGMPFGSLRGKSHSTIKTELI